MFSPLSCSVRSHLTQLRFKRRWAGAVKEPDRKASNKPSAAPADSLIQTTTRHIGCIQLSAASARIFWCCWAKNGPKRRSFLSRPTKSAGRGRTMRGRNACDPLNEDQRILPGGKFAPQEDRNPSSENYIRRY